MVRTNLLMTLLFLLVSVLFSQNTIISTTWGPPSTADEWQKFSISLTADEFDISDSEFADVMANVQRIRIQTESHSGYDVGSIDQVRVGDRFSSSFDSGLDGWNAHGDGTLNWIENEGISNSGHIAIHDWARGDWHYAVAPAEWSGDWSGLIGSSFEFYYKSDYPDAATVLEISSEFEKRIILNATPLITPQNTRSKVKVSLNEIPDSDVEISLSSENSCFQVPSSVIIPAGDEYTEFDATVPEDAETGCTSAIEASASGYVPARLILTVGESAGGGGTAKLCGQVTDATNGEGIAGAVVTVADLSAVTDDNGNYCIDNVPTDIISANFSGEPRSGPAPLTVQFNDLSGAGSPTITASADNYSTFRSTVSLSSGEEKTLDISLSPGITDAEMRIVLNWGENPRDLDLHVLVPGDATHSSSHVYFSDKGEQESFPYAFLDHDDRYSYGPETITLGMFIPGTYKFYVHKYAGTGDLTTSEAVIQIYDKSGLINTVNVPVSGTGDYWAVGEIDGRTGQVLINSVIQEEEPSLSGMTARLQKTLIKGDSFSTAEITSWEWDFNDDGVIDSNSENPSWIYYDSGDYTVSLTVSDGTNSYTETKTNYITVTGESYSDDAYHVSITSIDATNFPLVKIFVSVIDTATGLPLGELSDAAFDITENGMAVSDIIIEKLSISSGAKADIAFIFDTTGSMGGVMNTLKNRCLAFADSIAVKGIDYRLGLVTFADEVLSIHDFTSDAREFKTWIEGLNATGGGDSKENALEAVESAARLSFRDVTQKIAILITDADYHEAGESGDGITDFNTESIISFLNDRDILCNVVGPDMSQHKKIAKQTRGYYYRIQEDFSDIIDRLGDQISNQYVITFVPTNTTPDNSYRTVKVAIDHDGKNGQDRESYYAGSTQLVSHPPVVMGLKGKVFKLDIYVQNVTNLSASKYMLTYDKTKVKAVNVLSGEFMSSGGASETFIYEIEHNSGKVEINQSRLVQSGSTESISGSGLLATVEFEVLVDECTSSIDFYGLDFRQLNGESIEISATGSQVKSAGVAGASSILCDFDQDLDIDTRDFALLGTYWKPVNSTLGDVGPASGAVPLLTSAPDGKVDFEDLFTFTRMWNWYYLSLGTSGTGLAKENATLSWDLINDKNLLQMNVKIQNVSDLSMGHLTFYYNDAALSVKRIEQGNVLATADASCGLISDVNQAGVVDVAFSKLAHINQSAALDPSGVLFSVTFEKTGTGGQTALEPGSVDLRSQHNQQIQVHYKESDDLSFEAVPATFQLTNYPNPFNNRTKIQYQLPKETYVDIQVINILGQPVRVLVRKRMDAGEYEIHWDGKNNTGVDVMSGMYMLRMTAGEETLVRKLLFLK